MQKCTIGILGGTREGRLLADFCRKERIPAAVSVATSYGEELLTPGPFLRVHTGRMEKEELLSWIRQEKIGALADATHPYARVISENAEWACRQAGIPYGRLVRDSGEEKAEEENGRIIRTSSMEEAVQVLARILQEGRGEKGLITTGSKELAQYTRIPDYAERLYVRVLPSREGIDACLKLGWKGSHVIAMQGRFHFYEGYAPAMLALGVRAMRRLGVETLLVTNAAGGVNLSYRPGTLMAISDHINFARVNPLIGENDDDFGPRFPDQSRVYDPALRAGLLRVAEEEGVDVQEGVYMMFTGPCFETPAEIRMARALGADAVGMSTVPEAIAATHCGMRVLGISLITNMAAGILDQKLTHEEVQETANLAAQRFERLVDAAIERVF